VLAHAYVPDARLIFLHNVHDVVEQWDALRHVPALLEREIYSLANVYHLRGDGRLDACAAGFLVCLGDGIDRDEWAWLRRRWELAFARPPRRTLGATLLWSDAAMRSGVDDFIRTRAWLADRLLAHLMARGAPVQCTVRPEGLNAVRGPILVLNPHLLPADELAKVFGYGGGPIVAVGRKADCLPKPPFEFEDAGQLVPAWCGVYGSTARPEVKIEKPDPAEASAGQPDAPDPRGYWDSLPSHRVSEGFLRAAAQAVLKSAGLWTVAAEEDSVTLMVQEETDGTWRVAIKSQKPFYVRPQIDLGRPIQRIDVLTEFPSVLVRPQGTTFSVRVPGRGIVVLSVKLGPAGAAGGQTGMSAPPR